MTKNTVWQRAPDRRFKCGDEFAGEAWRNLETGAIKYVVVGHSPEEAER